MCVTRIECRAASAHFLIWRKPAGKFLHAQPDSTLLVRLLAETSTRHSGKLTLNDGFDLSRLIPLPMRAG